MLLGKNANPSKSENYAKREMAASSSKFWNFELVCGGPLETGQRADMKGVGRWQEMPIQVFSSNHRISALSWFDEKTVFCRGRVFHNDAIDPSKHHTGCEMQHVM